MFFDFLLYVYPSSHSLERKLFGNKMHDHSFVNFSLQLAKWFAHKVHLLNIFK